MKSTRIPPVAALVTGATSSIGEAFARGLPRATSLLLTGRDEAALKRLATDLSSGGRLIETLGADLATDNGLDMLCAAAERFGIDLLVCNAGLGPFGDFLTVEEAALRATILVNVTAPLVLMRRLLVGMIERAGVVKSRAGLIVVSSGAAFLPVPRLATYAASKAFDLSLTEALAAELTGQPIDVLALCPTLTRSRFAERSGFGHNLPGAQSPEHVAQHALRALGRQRTLWPALRIGADWSCLGSRRPGPGTANGPTPAVSTSQCMMTNQQASGSVNGEHLNSYLSRGGGRGCTDLV